MLPMLPRPMLPYLSPVPPPATERIRGPASRVRRPQATLQSTCHPRLRVSVPRASSTTAPRPCYCTLLPCLLLPGLPPSPSPMPQVPHHLGRTLQHPDPATFLSSPTTAPPRLMSRSIPRLPCPSPLHMLYPWAHRPHVSSFSPPFLSLRSPALPSPSPLSPLPVSASRRRPAERS
jgi:hypothetical protein